jgi:hypothetical protein
LIKKYLNDSEYHPLQQMPILGAWGIKEALDNGADIVVCPRVTDAAVVIGPAAWKFNWQRNDYDALQELLRLDILLNVDVKQQEEIMHFLKKFQVLIM